MIVHHMREGAKSEVFARPRNLKGSPVADGGIWPGLLNQTKYTTDDRLLGKLDLARGV